MAGEDWKLQVSFKIGNDMINVRANTGDELSVSLESIGDYAPQIIATRKALEAAEVVGPLSTGGSTEPTKPQNFSQRVQSTVPSAMGPTCVHGARIHRVGVSKTTGQPYDFWACPTPKGTPDQCRPVNG